MPRYAYAATGADGSAQTGKGKAASVEALSASSIASTLAALPLPVWADPSAPVAAYA